MEGLRLLRVEGADGERRALFGMSDMDRSGPIWASVASRLGFPAVGSLIKKRRKRMRKKKHKKMLKATRWQRRAGK
jgi:hypothetical protein